MIISFDKSILQKLQKVADQIFEFFVVSSNHDLKHCHIEQIFHYFVCLNI